MDDRIMVVLVLFITVLIMIFEITMRCISQKLANSQGVTNINRYMIKTPILKTLMVLLMITLGVFTTLSFDVEYAVILIICYMIILLWSFEMW